MPTSGTVTFRTNRNEIIKGALRMVSAYDIENSAGPTANQITVAAEALNLLVKQWEARGLQLWEKRWAVVFPQESQGVFTFGSPGPAGDHATLATPLGVGGFVQTTLASDAAAGASSIVVESTSSSSTAGISAVTITNGYNIGVELDSGAVDWTTVNGAPVGTTVTLTATLDGAASEGNNVFVYQTKLFRPLRVTDAFVRNTNGNNDTPVNLISREEYMRFGNKNSTGVPTQIYYDPQSNIGYLYLYPAFSTADQLLYLEIQKPIDDFSTSTDDYDLPQEWGMALKCNLALWLAPENEVPQVKFNQIEKLASLSYGIIDSWDQESASVFLQANTPVAYPNA